ncbi:MAG TPA: uroporphyrinogen decarboxylase [Kiritimatiellia bacterium]|nr:uroporphyrinogen decarboxylase [Kiritimatiellia bacterium]
MRPRFLRACHGQPVDRTPIWLMRQAGRYMAEYRALRSKHALLDMIKQPDLAAEVTLQPVNAFGVDAAIIFADILPLLESLGLPLRFESGRGPIIDRPLRQTTTITSLSRQPAAEALPYTLEAIRIARNALPPDIPLIGFSGAPFTLACYAIEGGTSKEYENARRLMFEDPAAWNRLMDLLADAVFDYLHEQRKAGAQALQIFDSWAGLLSPDRYREVALPWTSSIIRRLKDTEDPLHPVPIIHFATGNPLLLPALREAGPDVVGIDWKISIHDALTLLGPGIAFQGNLDPVSLLAPPHVFLREAKAILDHVAGRPGHIFNLGHGVLKHTPEHHVKELVDFVQSHLLPPVA